MMQIFINKIRKVALILALIAFSTELWAQSGSGPIIVEGTVVDAASGRPLPGISVGISGFSADLTDVDGKFTLVAPNASSVVIVAGEGFQRKEVPLKGRTEILIGMYEASFNSIYGLANMPNDVRVPLAGTVSAVSSINTEKDKWHASAETPENYLQGKIAGLDIKRRSGAPGMGGSMVLRGYSSLYTTNQPLIIIDGVIYDMEGSEGSLVSNNFINPLNHIDIKDIDNITVIKDASSIYGAKGANGAIIITTGHAEELATKIDFAVYTGVNSTPKHIPVMDANGYRTYLSEVLQGSGYTPSQIADLPFMNDNTSAPGYYNYHNNTDWQKEVFKKSYSKNYYLRVTGGDNIAKYALSLGYMDQDGIVQNTGFERYNTRFNADLNMSPKLTVNANLGFSYGEHELSDQGLALKTNPIYMSLIKAPFTAPQSFSDEGVLSPNFSDVDLLNVGNPVAVVNNMQALSKNYRFLGSVKFNYDFNKYLRASTQLGVTYDKIRESFFVPRFGVLADTLDNDVAESRMGSQIERLFSIYNDTRLSYSNVFNDIHGLNANVGIRYIDSNSEHDYGLGFNSATDELRSVGTGSTMLRRAGGSIGKWRWMNLYAGVNYNYLQKYFLQFNVAMDGSSRFGEEADGISFMNTRFGAFPSIGAGWLMSSENFMSQIDFVDVLKIRATYSLTGNDDIGKYTARKYYVSQNLLGLQGLVVGNIGNPALQWETHKKLNVGADFALLNERVAFSLDLYKNTTDNMFIQEKLTNVAGLDYMFTNNGAMESSGVELSLNTRVINSAAFQWDIAFNIARYDNEITKLPNDQIVTQFAGANILTKVGEQANLFYGYQTRGVYATQAEAISEGHSTRTPQGEYKLFQGGDVRFVDQNGDKIIDEEDMVVIGNPNPDFTGMFRSAISYKRFSLDAVFTFSKGNDLFNYTRAQLEAMSGPENQTQHVANRWRTDGQVTDVPKASWGDPMGNARFSDRWIEDGSYLRLRTLTLKYDLPFNNQYIKYLSIYATANNLVTWTKYLGYDPEFSAAESIFAQGIDNGLTPQFQSILLGVRFGL